MSKEPTWLLEYRRNIHSQLGEDGIIEKILEVISRRNKWCVEFGAWDGIFLNNTRNLIENKEYSAILIEADEDRFHDLEINYSEYDNVVTLNQFVGFNQDDNLDQILGATEVPLDFDLLSIDIDGNDYHVWKAMVKYKPKVVVIEFNHTIPTNVRFVQEADPSVNQGASLLSLVELARDKGYELVSVLKLNAFFVRKEEFKRFEIESNAPEILRTDLSAVTYLFSGYDGTIFFSGGCELPWHAIDLKASRMQCLPAILRTYPGNYSFFQKLFFWFYAAFAHPEKLIQRLKMVFK